MTESQLAAYEFVRCLNTIANVVKVAAGSYDGEGLAFVNWDQIDTVMNEKWSNVIANDPLIEGLHDELDAIDDEYTLDESFLEAGEEFEVVHDAEDA